MSDWNYLQTQLYSIQESNGEKYIQINDLQLKQIIQEYFRDIDMLHDPVIPMDKLILILDDFKRNYPNYIELVNQIEIHKCESNTFSPVKGSVFNTVFSMLTYGFISFEYLTYLFLKGQFIRTTCNDDKYIIGSKVVHSIFFPKKDTQIQSGLAICAEMIDSDGKSFIRKRKTYSIDFWEGFRKINELPIVPLLETEKTYENLVERGRKFKKYAIDHHFLQYKGNEYRVMVDAAEKKGGYNHKEKDDDDEEDDDDNDDEKEDNNNNVCEVREEELFMCAPTLYAFCFAEKKWNHVNVFYLNEISYNEEAFDKLVLDDDTKGLIESLVESKYNETDLIKGKGSGCSILLYGPPGVGKTLTAETISEKLHRPLYHISIGELGTNAECLENKLKGIFRLVHSWNAIALIDEADIFFERRSSHEIERNSLVCVFLRLLDYHRGILFLTTNRVNCFDGAFQSRISVFLEYKEPDTKAREILWKIFLNHDEINNVNITNLANIHLSGREIKNAVKLARIFAKKKNQLVDIGLLEKIVNLSSIKTECLSEVNKRKPGQDDYINSKKAK